MTKQQQYQQQGHSELGQNLNQGSGFPASNLCSRLYPSFSYARLYPVPQFYLDSSQKPSLIQRQSP